ncbi:uncharacterized protein LOC131239896 [Magnolia sinica]|uniref:uncharacterized protein LOC131239896 n=1 Tax=Magnolia sinica TaxID=86752 RepID=UPI00265AE95C|nr:uncharacterized protein LOC131239896 [Magnolia sinica]
MMLKTTFSPILSAFPTKAKIPRFSKPSMSISNTSTQHSPPACQNASTTIPLPPTSAYIHLPFCRKRCHYCDFPIVALGSSSSPPQQTQDPTIADPRILNYIQLLRREIDAKKPRSPSDPVLETVFFGGGTPSLVPPTLVSSVLETLRSKFGVCPTAEISMEMDPGTFDAKKMRELKELGVNRVSLGVQAFQEELLRGCGRAHGVSEVYEAIEIVGSCGVENWSVDLISSLPHQTPEMWEESLGLAIKVGPNHVSVYDLQVEQGTKFGQWYTPGEFPLPSENQSAKFYKMASEMLTNAGYNHYEISSYCKNRFECKHNLAYWQNKSFYGFGLGSASYIDGVRFSRPRKMKEYADYVQKLEDRLADGHNDNNNNSHVDVKDMAMDIVMLSLRTARGLDVKEFGRAFGKSLVLSIFKAFEPYMESGHVVALDEKRRALDASELSSPQSDACKIEQLVAFIRLSDPDGFLLSNELISIAFGIISP